MMVSLILLFVAVFSMIFCPYFPTQVHPQGWCVASRNTSSDENSEVQIVIAVCIVAVRITRNSDKIQRHRYKPSFFSYAWL